MSIQTINPATGLVIENYDLMLENKLEQIISDANQALLEWRNLSFQARAKNMQALSDILLKNKETYAQMISQEMGKLISFAISEVEKCAWACRYFAENAEKLLEDKYIETEMNKSYVTYNPLGVVLAIMPWNFPFWQVFRFAAPTLMAGNVALLKHSPNTTGCALLIEKIFENAGFPAHVFTTLIVEEKTVATIIKHPKIAAVTLTGSPRAGRQVAEVAGSVLKKVVLELGGSDPYLILEDADLEKAVDAIVTSRMTVSGQSCIAPKRILLVPAIRANFEKILLQKVQAYQLPMSAEKKASDKSESAKAGAEITGTDKFSSNKSETDKSQIKQIGPIARKDLRDNLHKQVQESVKLGAKLLYGGTIPDMPGFYYPPTVLTDVKPGMPAYEEELFGPVITLIDVKDEQDAIRVANITSYGLGSAIFTNDLKRGENIAKNQLQSGSCFINDFVKSDPRLPFGGIKNSGFGRELSEEGIKEFVNIKTVVIK